MAPATAPAPTPRDRRRWQQSHGAYAPPLLADFENRERSRDHRAASTAASAGGRRAGCRRRRLAVLRRDDEDVAGLRIERQRLAARHRLQRLLEDEVRRAVLLD